MRVHGLCLAVVWLAACGGSSDADGGTDAGTESGADIGTDAPAVDAPGMDGACATDDDSDGHHSMACGGDDCDDADGNRYPGNLEVCDAAGHDEDCDPASVGPDEDHDGSQFFACCNGATCGDDCDDHVATINPTAIESCNGRDDDCDGSVDEGVATSFCFDGDGDAHGDLASAASGCAVPLGGTTVCNDCADWDTGRYPGATDLCNGADDDCDGLVDEGCACTMGATRACGMTLGACMAGVQGCPSGVWETACTGGVFPMLEVCNGIDDDCDGATDEGVTFSFYPDCDADGYGDSAGAMHICSAPVGVPPGCVHGTWAMTGGDCTDTDATMFPGHGCTTPDGGVPDSGMPDGGMPDGGACLDCDGTAGCDTDCSTCATGCSWACTHAVCGAVAVEVDQGSDSGCARQSDGTVACWGLNAHGSLGDGTTTQRLTPVQVSGLFDAVQVSVGSDCRSNDTPHACARRATGAVVCWGSNDHGKLGDGTTTDRSTPVVVASSLTDVTWISAGGNATCALNGDGTVSCWGYGGEGMLGNGATSDSSAPVTVSGISTATQLSAGRDHACARLMNSTVKCWGRNNDGQLGDGSITDSSTPVTVSGLTDAVAVFANPANASGSSNSATCALRLGGAVSCWGGNLYAQLGNGTLVNSRTPVAVTGLIDAVDIAMRKDGACAWRSTGAVACWGIANNGGDGDGTGTHTVCGGSYDCATTPVTVTGLTDAVGVGAGVGGACAVRANGAVMCWGSNVSGEAGDGTTTNRFTPVPVTPPP